jgi:hypothetical protein
LKLLLQLLLLPAATIQPCQPPLLHAARDSEH